MAFVNVEGEVSRVHKNGNGFGLKESFTNQEGKTRTTFWAVFPKDAVQVMEGARVQVSGALRTSVTDPKPDQNGQDRYYVDHLVGSAQVKVVSMPAQVAPDHPSQGGNFGGGFDNEAPF